VADDGFEADTHRGDFDSAFAAARFRVDQTYSTPAMQPYPMEPHATTAVWHGDRLTVYDSDQGGAPVQAALADLFGLAPGAVNVVAEHVGGTPSATSSQYRRCTDRNGLCRPINTPQRRGVAITP
jgi:CO/xanthine dehydrogenase Mo-binding subunit